MGRISPKPVFASQTWVTNYVSGSGISDDQTLQEVCGYGATTTVPITISTSGSSFAASRFTSNVDMINHKITNVVDPTSNQDAATKHYVDIHNNAMSGSFGYYYNVMDYGAKGDGATEDHVVIQSAITAAGNAGGGTVILPEGTYLIGDTLTVPNNVKLMGIGPGSIIKAKDALDKNIITITDKSGVNVCYLKIDGNNANNTATKSAIIFEGSSDCRVFDIEIVDMYGQSIGIGTEGNPSNNIIIENNTITGGTSNHIDVNSSQNVRIRNNHIAGNLGGEAGIFLGHAKTQDHLVEGNYITAANWGVVLDNTVFSAEQPDVRRIRIIGNYFSGSQASGIALYGAQHCVIANNECVSNNAGEVGNGSGSGIFLTDENSRGASYNTITGNRCYDAQTPKLQPYGIFATGSADYNYITGNNLEGNLTGELSLEGSHNVVYGSDAIAANFKSNSNIYINYDGADTESYLYFYDNSSPTDAYLRWYDSLSRFHFNKGLAVDGNIEAWNGSVLSQGEIYINSGGDDGDSFLYYRENSSDTGAYLMWDDSETEFSFNKDITVNNSPVSDKPYGELYEYNDGGSTIAITTAGTFYGWVTATSGSFNRMTADLSNGNADHIIVQDAGTYFVAASITVDGEVNAIVDGTVCLNGTPQQNLHFHRDMGTSANEGVASISGLLVCAADDEISLRFTSDSNGDDVIAHHINLTMHHLTA